MFKRIKEWFKNRGLKQRAKVHELKWEEYQDAEIELYVMYVAKKTKAIPATVRTAMLYLELIESGLVQSATVEMVDTPADGEVPLYSMKCKRKDEKKIEEIVAKYGGEPWYQDALRRIKGY